MEFGFVVAGTIGAICAASFAATRRKTAGTKGAAETSSLLSATGTKALRPHGPATQSLLEQFGSIYAEAKRDKFSLDNPDGFVDANLSENKLSFDILEEPIREACAALALNDIAGYDNMRGTKRFRDALANFFTNFIFDSEVQASADDIVISSGISALLDTVFTCICDDGDGVLCPAPYHSRFDRNVLVRNRGLSIVPVQTETNAYIVTPEMLEAASRDAFKSGRCTRIRALLLTNPNNPVGNVYKREELEAIVEWCATHHIHLVSDEVYATTIFNPKATFVSVVAVAASRGVDPNYIHVIYGLSKDFAMSGFRVGIFYSRCAQLVKALSNISMFTSVSSLSQHALSAVFEDQELIRSYIKENVRRVAASYAILSNGLTAAGIPFVEGEGGLFVWISFRHILQRPSDGEVTLHAVLDFCHYLAHEKKVIITPGHLCLTTEHGHFRCCFTAMSPSALEELVRRLTEVSVTYRPYDDDDQQCVTPPLISS